MPWKPSTDFEEEIVNLQPDHDFIFGALSEPDPQPCYPRPQLHIEYAASKKRLTKKQQEEYETTGKFNGRLHVISQVQRIAHTKPLGEQPTENDWDNDKDAEQEVVAMMRHFGLGPSLEEPINDKVTISTYPSNSGVQVMRNGRKKVPLLFDEKLFELKPKSSNSSTSFESASTTDAMLSFCEESQSRNTNSNGFSSVGDINSDSFHSDTSNISPTEYNKVQADRHTLLLQAERLHQYTKLHDKPCVNSSQSSFSPQSSCYDSFSTALDDSTSSISGEMPISTSLNQTCHEDSVKHKKNKSNNSFLEEFYDSSSLNASDKSCSTSSSFLQRFVKSHSLDDCGTSVGSTSSSSPILAAPTYASTLKNSIDSKSKSAAICNVKLIQSPQFFTPRELYERKRHKQH